MDFILLDHRLGSLEIALKRTRPRQRIYVIGRYSMTERGGCQEENYAESQTHLCLGKPEVHATEHSVLS